MWSDGVRIHQQVSSLRQVDRYVPVSSLQAVFSNGKKMGTGGRRQPENSETWSIKVKETLQLQRKMRSAAPKVRGPTRESRSSCRVWYGGPGYCQVSVTQLLPTG